MGDVSVDLGPIPLDHARVVQRSLQCSFDSGFFWLRETNDALLEVKAMLELRIAQAEKEPAA